MANAALRAQLLDDALSVPAEFGGWSGPEALAATQESLGRFAEVLSAWPALVATARRLPALAVIAGE
jgi:hypothetical protein